MVLLSHDKQYMNHVVKICCFFRTSSHRITNTIPHEWNQSEQQIKLYNGVLQTAYEQKLLEITINTQLLLVPSF